MENCIFCKIIENQIPSRKIFENDKVLAFLDIACDCVGHTLVIPKQHFTNILDCPSEILKEVCAVVKQISNHYVENCGFSGVNIFNASGKDAEQSVFHLHFHIIPRKANDNITAWNLHDKLDIDLDEIHKQLALV